MISWRDTLSLAVAEGKLEGIVSRMVGLDFPVDFAPIAVADYDNDGWPDLMGADRSVSPARPMMLHNEGDGSFRKREGVLPEIRFAEDSPLLGGCAFGDFDGDGDADLFVAGGVSIGVQSDAGMLLRNDEGRFVEVGEGFGGDSIAPAQIAVWWDFDGDGILDLHIGSSHRAEGENDLYRGDGRGGFAPVTVVGGVLESSGPPDTPSAGMAVADFDGDGRQDLYLPIMRGANRLLLGDGRGGFTEATSPDLADPGRALGTAVGDIDNDGDLDIFQPAGGLGGPTGKGDRSLLLLNLGEGNFLDVTEAVGFGARLELAFARLIDIDNDGDLDLLGGSPPVLFLNSGGGIFVDRSFQTDLSGMRALADFDGDGFVDVCAEGGLFRNRGNDNHFLRVELVGTQSNRDGIGARLSARAGELAQVREMVPGDGWFQDERVAHFGLGNRDRVDELEIRWPSGRVDRLRDIPADSRIRVVEGEETFHRVRRSVWERFSDAEVEFGKKVEWEMRVRPGLFAPGGKVVRATADLSSLGGPQESPLEDLGDGSYHLSASFAAGGLGLEHAVELFFEQETLLGTRWIGMSRSVELIGDPPTAVLETYMAGSPERFALEQNFPNPFNGKTVIRFALQSGEEVELALYNLAGQKLETLVRKRQDAGRHEVIWQAKEYAPGVYLFVIEAGNVRKTMKMLLLK